MSIDDGAGDADAIAPQSCSRRRRRSVPISCRFNICKSSSFLILEKVERSITHVS